MNVKANRRGLGRVIAPLALLVMAVAVLFMGGMGFTKAHALVTKPFTNVSINGKMLNYTSTMFANSENKYRLFATTDVNPSTSDIENWNNEFIELNTNGGSWGSTINSTIYKRLFPAAGTYSCVIGHQDNQTGRYSADSAIFQNVIQALPEDPVKEGYTFVGWYLDEALTQPYDGRPITSDVSLYAKFEINSYDVTLDVNGGRLTDSTGAEVSKVTGDHGFNVVNVLDGYTLEREGYDFLGWYIGDEKIDGTYQVKGAITLTARWQIKTYTVTFVVDGEVYKTLEVNHGTTFQQAMKEDKELAYMFLLDENGAAIGKGTAITGAVTVPVGEMTTEEKVATFIGNNWWLLWLLGALAVAGIGAAVIASIVAKKRG